MSECQHPEIVPLNAAETQGKCEKCGASFRVGKAYLSSGKPFFFPLPLAGRLDPHDWYGQEKG